MKKYILISSAVLMIGMSGCSTVGTSTPPATTGDAVATVESTLWFKSIRPAVATLGRLAIGMAKNPADKHAKELIIYDASHAFWSLTNSNNFDPAEITAVVGGWLPTKSWYNTVLAGVGLAFNPVKVWINAQIVKYGGQKTADVVKVWNDALNQAALGCIDATWQDLNFPPPPQ